MVKCAPSRPKKPTNTGNRLSYIRPRRLFRSCPSTPTKPVPVSRMTPGTVGLVLDFNLF